MKSENAPEVLYIGSENAPEVLYIGSENAPEVLYIGSKKQSRRLNPMRRRFSFI